MKVLFETKNLLIMYDKDWFVQFKTYNNVWINGFRLWLGYISIHYIKETQ